VPIAIPRNPAEVFSVGELTVAAVLMGSPYCSQFDNRVRIAETRPGDRDVVALTGIDPIPRAWEA
jgi:hypothetical protein